MQENVVTKAIGPSTRKWILISAIIGYLALLFFLFFFVDVGRLFSVLTSLNPGIYALALSCVMMSIFFHSLVWHQLLSALSIKLSLRRTYTLYWVGIFVDSLVPGGWSGDLFKAYLLSKDPNLDGGKTVASVVAKNVYEAIFNLGSLIFGLAALLTGYALLDNGILITLGGIILLLTLPLIVLLVISFKPKEAKRIFGSLLRFLGLNRFNAAMEKIIEHYHEGMKGLLQNPRMFLKPIVLSFVAWGFEVLTLLLVISSLGQSISPDKVIIVRSISGNLEAQGYAFAGYAQIVTTALYTTLGIDLALGASVALLGGLVVFWLRTLISYGAFHCTVFSPCANFVCRTIGLGPYAESKSCELEKKPNTMKKDDKTRVN